METSKKSWICQSILLYIPFLIEFAAFPIFMMIKPAWLGGLLFWIFYTYLFYGLAIVFHIRWRKFIGEPLKWELDLKQLLIAVIVGASFQHIVAFTFSESQLPKIIREFTFSMKMQPLYMGVGQFVLQNIYYIFEFTLVACIIDCAQKAVEKFGGSKNIPWGGLFLGLTWGLGHAITKGVIASGLVSLSLSLVAGFLYIKLDRKVSVAWAVVASAYLL